MRPCEDLIDITFVDRRESLALRQRFVANWRYYLQEDHQDAEGYAVANDNGTTLTNAPRRAVRARLRPSSKPNIAASRYFQRMCVHQITHMK